MTGSASAGELLWISPGATFADDLLDMLKAHANPDAGRDRALQIALGAVTLVAGGATFYGLMRLHRRGAAA